MKSILSTAGLMAASIASVPAASIVVNTVGTVNSNARTILEAAGNSLSAPAFAANVATAFATDTGGVWDFEGDPYAVFNGETITLNYGASLANSLVLTLTIGDPIGSGLDNGLQAGEATSGTRVMGFSGNFTTRFFTPDQPLLTVGVFNTDRNSAGRNPVLSVVFQDNTTASTSGAHADDWFFHGLSGTMENPIVSFSISQDNFVRYDDLGFIVAVPEPSSALLLGLAGFGVLIRRRR